MNFSEIESIMSQISCELYTPENQIQFLLELISESNKQSDTRRHKIVEIGTAELGTTIPIAVTYPESIVYTIDLYESNKANMKTYIDNLQNLVKLDVNNVIPICGDSNKVGEVFDDEIDFLWIDGCHEKDIVEEDILQWQKTLKSGCIISGHDYNHPDDVKAPVNEIVRDSEQYEAFNVYDDDIWYAYKI